MKLCSYCAAESARYVYGMTGSLASSVPCQRCWTFLDPEPLASMTLQRYLEKIDALLERLQTAHPLRDDPELVRAVDNANAELGQFEAKRSIAFREAWSCFDQPNDWRWLTNIRDRFLNAYREATIRFERG